MSFQFCRRKLYFLLALALPGYAAVHPVQHSAREQVNAQVLNAASQQIESLAQQRQWQWHDYRYTFKVYIPSQIATAAPCATAPGVTLTSPAEIALNRMNFTVSCPQSWQMNVAVRPDVLVPVVMAKSLVARDTPLTANDVELKPYNVSAQRRDVLMDLNEAIGLSSKHALQPGRPLTKEELVSPVLIERDQPVMIVYQSAGITASMPGVALKNGRKGEMVKVRNASSQRVISAIVAESGVVTTVSAE
ncbi:TPA: flagellar basal body P-ring formation protein FlgA [Escherichia coli]|nr:flagellar basal body P-ring formation protein FlgA [Escherichia coli]